MARTRHEYVLDLSKVDAAALAASRIESIEIRGLELGDREALASLMLDAYRGTIDDEGEDLADAQREVDGFYAETPILSASLVAVVEGALACAALIRLWRGQVLIRSVMTASAQKRRGLAGLVLARSLARLVAEGHGEVHAWITEGNAPSEAAHARLGFERSARV